MNILGFQKKIDGIARFFLYVLIFWIAFSNAVVESCVIAVFLLWFLKKFLQVPFDTFKNLTAKKKFQAFLKNFKPKNSFLNLPIAVFLYICLLSALWSRMPLYSLHGLISKTLEWFVIYFLVLEFLSEKKHIIVALAIFLFSAVSVCSDSLIQFYITGKDIFCGFISSGRATACFSTGNDLGGYLIFPLFLSASFVFVEKNRKVRAIFFGLIFALAFWVLMITLSRGAWIACVLGAVIFLFLKNKIFSYLLIISLIVIAIDLFIVLPLNTKQQMRVDSQEVLSMVHWRKTLWMATVTMIQDRPLLGHGPNTFMKFFQEYRKKFDAPREYSPSYAHNCYMQMAAEVGLLGLGCFLWMMARFFKNIFQIIGDAQKKRRDDPLVILIIGFASGAAGFLAHSFVDTHLYSLRLSALFWVMVGLSVGIYNLLSQTKNYDIKGT